MPKHLKCMNVILYLFTILFVPPAVAGVTASTDMITGTHATTSEQPADGKPTDKEPKTQKQTDSAVVKQQPAKSAAKQPKKAIEPDTPEIKALKGQLESLKLQKGIISAHSFIQTAKHKEKLLELQQEKDTLQLMNELQAQKIRHELVQLQADKEKLSLENELQAARQKQLLADLEAIKVRLALENEHHEQEKKKLLAKFNIEREQLALQNAIAEEKHKPEALKLQLDMAKLTAETSKVELKRAQASLKADELAQKINIREQQKKWENEVNKPKEYLINPFVDDHLIISDRKIELDIVIFWGTAKYVNERIHYYNNKSTEYPIFLVIDTCFGGSVLEGAKILEAIHASRAPVYVVVKTFAASMAAVITALAEHSYSYPNALIIQHQIFTFAFGNQREIAEQMEITNEWTRRILHPVAQKMGITMEEFVKKMYEKNSLGDWLEFADNATNLKWVNKVVKDIRDSSFTTYPATDKNEEKGFTTARAAIRNEKVDSQGKRYVELPRLNPLDVYFLYNPNKYYRYR